MLLVSRACGNQRTIALSTGSSHTSRPYSCGAGCPFLTLGKPDMKPKNQHGKVSFSGCHGRGLGRTCYGGLRVSEHSEATLTEAMPTLRYSKMRNVTSMCSHFRRSCCWRMLVTPGGIQFHLPVWCLVFVWPRPACFEDLLRLWRIDLQGPWGLECSVPQHQLQCFAAE